VIAATQHDTVYAFDADTSPCKIRSKSLLGSGETWSRTRMSNTGDLVPDIGIVRPTVIDGATKRSTWFRIENGTTFHQRLHALSLIDGSEKFAGPNRHCFIPEA